MDEIDKKQDQALNALFAAARSADPVPSGELIARIAADAAAVQARPIPVDAPVARRSVMQNISDALGGWAGVSTLAACVGLGIVVGFASPDTVLSYVPNAEVSSADDPFGFFDEDDF